MAGGEALGLSSLELLVLLWHLTWNIQKLDPSSALAPGPAVPFQVCWVPPAAELASIAAIGHPLVVKHLCFLFRVSAALRPLKPSSFLGNKAVAATQPCLAPLVPKPPCFCPAELRAEQRASGWCLCAVSS